LDEPSDSPPSNSARKAMPQVFHPSMNTFSRVSIFGALGFIAAILWLAAALVRSPYVTEAGVVREQPVPFSHKHHVGDAGIDCRYCHTSVETSAFAGMPATETCMKCHSHLFTDSPILEPVRASFREGRPLEWTRVHDLPDFAYFNHSIHIHKGIGCSTCHGRVDQMPLMWREHSLHMDWCLDCHREPERFVRPREEIYNMSWQPPPDQLAQGRKLVEEYNIQKKTDCTVCHR
jgi:hypothetical protein